jgi:hypothetical protein
MRDRHLLLAAFAFAFTIISVHGQSLVGEYADKSFMGGQGVFQMSVEEGGGKMGVWFSMAYNDGHGCGPEAAGSAKITGKNTLEFNFHDSSKNAGTGTATLTNDGIAVSLKVTRVGDSQCLELYKQSIRLKRIKK